VLDLVANSCIVEHKRRNAERQARSTPVGEAARPSATCRAGVPPSYGRLGRPARAQRGGRARGSSKIHSVSTGDQLPWCRRRGLHSVGRSWEPDPTNRLLSAASRLPALGEACTLRTLDQASECEILEVRPAWMSIDVLDLRIVG